MSKQSNIIPAIYSAGQFEATHPFDVVVDSTVYYTTEAIRTVSEMQSANIDIYSKVLQPVGIPKDETTNWINELLKNDAVIITLTSKGNKPVYVPSTYLRSFPAIDGVVYEHMCIVADLGAVPPTLKDKLKQQLDEISKYVESNIGVSATVQIGVIPTKSYVSKEQAENFENSRLLKIKNSDNLVLKNERQEKEIVELKAYITKLENALKAKT